MCYVYLGSHYSHFWWGWNKMGNPFIPSKVRLKVLGNNGQIDSGLRRSVGLSQKQLPLLLLHFPETSFTLPYFPKALTDTLFINPWPNLDTIQKVCFPSEWINLDFSPDLKLLEHYNELFFLFPRKETANTVTWPLWSWDHWSSGYLHAFTPRHFTMGRTASSS